jgi:hypothetical protein
MTNISNHFDILGRIPNVGNYVSTVKAGRFCIGRITRLCPKLIRVKRDTYDNEPSFVVYSSETMLINDDEIIIYKLKHGNVE